MARRWRPGLCPRPRMPDRFLVQIGPIKVFGAGLEPDAGVDNVPPHVKTPSVSRNKMGIQNRNAKAIRTQCSP